MCLITITCPVNPDNPDLSSKLVGPLYVVIRVRTLEIPKQKFLPTGGQSIFLGEGPLCPAKDCTRPAIPDF